MNELGPLTELELDPNFGKLTQSLWVELDPLKSITKLGQEERNLAPWWIVYYASNMAPNLAYEENM